MKNNPVLLEPMEFPEPVIEIAVEPKTKADQEKMGEALGRLAKKILHLELPLMKSLDKLLLKVWENYT